MQIAVDGSLKLLLILTLYIMMGIGLINFISPTGLLSFKS